MRLFKIENKKTHFQYSENEFFGINNSNYSTIIFFAEAAFPFIKYT